jgi:serine O-acetyltransferase
VVLIDAPSRNMVVGNPARLISGKKGDDMPGETMDHTSFIQWWLEYTI